MAANPPKIRSRNPVSAHADVGDTVPEPARVTLRNMRGNVIPFLPMGRDVAGALADCRRQVAA